MLLDTILLQHVHRTLLNSATPSVPAYHHPFTTPHYLPLASAASVPDGNLAFFTYETIQHPGHAKRRKLTPIFKFIVGLVCVFTKITSKQLKQKPRRRANKKKRSENQFWAWVKIWILNYVNLLNFNAYDFFMQTLNQLIRLTEQEIATSDFLPERK